MATPHMNMTPTTIPAGQSGTITVTFDLDPGTPDQPAVVLLKLDGVTKAEVDGVLKGVPAEQLPNVQVGTTGQGWEISTSAGTLNEPSPNVFTLTR